MQQQIQGLVEELSQVLFGKQAQIKLAVCCLLCKGHLLIEDLPGMGKTTLSHALAQTLGLSYQRIQFTSDLLPADIVGSSIFNGKEQSFDFHPGPLFSQVVLADEINRAGPKTQSALLEAMEERQVSVDGVRHSLPEPFFVIATQNPHYQSGTYPLPESQLDRFFMRLSLGYPDEDAERRLVKGEKSKSLEQLEVRLPLMELNLMQRKVETTMISDNVVDYIVALVNYTRSRAEYENPLSPRASIALALASKAWAVIEGRDYVTADDVQHVFPAIAEHRINPNAELRDTPLCTNLLKQVSVPV